MTSAVPGGRFLLLHKLLQAPTGPTGVAPASQPAEDVAQFVGSHALGPSTGNEVLERAVFGAANPDAVLPAGVSYGVAATLRCLGWPSNRSVRL